MKKTGLILILCILALAVVGFWLLNGTSPDQVERQETMVDVEDTFEK